MKWFCILAIALNTSASLGIDRPARFMQDTTEMLTAIPQLVSIGEVGRTADGKLCVIFTSIKDRVKTVTPMPKNGIYPRSVSRYRVDGQWYHEITYSDKSVRRVKVSR